MKKTRSYVKNGRIYIRNTGSYNEFTKNAIGIMPNGEANALQQKNLAQPGPNTAAAITTNNALKELNLSEKK